MLKRILDEVLGFSGRALRCTWRMITRPSIITLHGVKLALPPGISESMRFAFYAEFYETAEVLTLGQILSPIDTVVELGSSIGFIGVAAGKNRRPPQSPYDRSQSLTHSTNRSQFRAQWPQGAALDLRFRLRGPSADEVTFNISSDPWTSSAAPMANAARTDKVARVDVSKALGRNTRDGARLRYRGGRIRLIRQSGVPRRHPNLR